MFQGQDCVNYRQNRMLIMILITSFAKNFARESYVLLLTCFTFLNCAIARFFYNKSSQIVQTPVKFIATCKSVYEAEIAEKSCFYRFLQSESYAKNQKKTSSNKQAEISLVTISRTKFSLRKPKQTSPSITFTSTSR